VDFSAVVRVLAASDRTAALRRRKTADRSPGPGIPGNSRQSAASREPNRTRRTTVRLLVGRPEVVRTEGRSTAVGSHALR
jgi:hypothetical protein